MSDLIRREDAIKAVKSVSEDYTGKGKRNYHPHIDFIVDELKRSVPSACRPQGEWIFKTVFPNDKSEFPMGYLECSICGSTHANKTPCNYCDNCGAKMKGADNE